MSVNVLPQAADRAVELLTDLVAGNWSEVCRDFDETMRSKIDADQIASVWAQVIGTVGGYERMGEPVVHQAGDYTVVDIPLYFEAGEMTGKISYDRDAQVAGLFIGPPPGS